MNKGILKSLSEDEKVLVLQTERARLAELDEDGLVELHTRVRRARNKYVKIYRRQASARVPEKGGRGKARPVNRRNADRAEVFETALARVSRRLGIVARRSATALRTERISAAAGVKTGKDAPKAGPDDRAAGSPGRAHQDRRAVTPASRKRVAGSAAAGARRQAKKDNR